MIPTSMEDHQEVASTDATCNKEAVFYEELHPTTKCGHNREFSKDPNSVFKMQENVLIPSEAKRTRISSILVNQGNKEPVADGLRSDISLQRMENGIRALTNC